MGVLVIHAPSLSGHCYADTLEQHRRAAGDVIEGTKRYAASVTYSITITVLWRFSQRSGVFEFDFHARQTHRVTGTGRLWKDNYPCHGSPGINSYQAKSYTLANLAVEKGFSVQSEDYLSRLVTSSMVALFRVWMTPASMISVRWRTE